MPGVSGAKHGSTGMVLGKFMPPHTGHQYLVEFARGYVEKLTVVVGSLAREPIPGALRHAWMRELYPDVNVVHLTDENPQLPHEHPDFWEIWKDSLLRVLPGKPDYVFAGEDYGGPLAKVLGATFVPVNGMRELVPVSGTAIRTDPAKHWAYIPRAVRPYFVKRICIFGPESTGKSTLTRNLAEAYGTVAVPEFARTVLEAKNGQCDAADIEVIARGQLASEDALARHANRYLFCDTDVLETTIWSDVLFGACPDWIREEARARRYDLYLLTDVDVPWVADIVRYLPKERESFLARCEATLRAHDCHWVKLSGSWEARMAKARAAIDALPA